MSAADVPSDLLGLLSILGGLFGFLGLLDVLDLAGANIDLPAGFLLLGAGLVVSVACSGSLSGLLLFLSLLFLLLGPLLLRRLLTLLLLLLALLLLEERGYPLVLFGLITHC
jgi:hypothetical protein